MMHCDFLDLLRVRYLQTKTIDFRSVEGCRVILVSIESIFSVCIVRAGHIALNQCRPVYRLHIVHIVYAIQLLS